MPHYLVTWEIEVKADTPLEAVKLARFSMSWPTPPDLVFHATDLRAGKRNGGKQWQVDLSDDTVAQVLP